MSAHEDETYYDSLDDTVQTLIPTIRLRKKELLGELLGTTRAYEIRAANTINFVKYIREYAYNNPINPEHVTYLATGIKNSQSVIGSFITVELANGDIYLLDGHHRLTALKTLPDADLAQVELTVHNYKSDVINSQQTMDLFHKINKVKPYNINVEIDKDCLKIISELKRRDTGFKNCIRNNESRIVQFPNYLEAKFKQMLEARLKQLSPRYSVENVITQILDYNLYLQTLTQKKVFKCTSVSSEMSAKYEKTRTHKFMLALPIADEWPSKVLG